MISVKNLTKTYRTPGEDIHVLKNLDLSLATGETAAIVGPSGSGKSTLLNLLGALDRPTSGTIEIAGQDISTLTDEQAAAFRNHSLGFIFQQQHLLPQLNVLENVLIPRLAGDWKESSAETETRAREILATVGLSDRLKHLPWQLSGGEKLRTAVARALINRPKLILADEPTGSLDPTSTDTVADLLLSLNRDHQVTLIVVTHNPALAEKMAKTYHLHSGHLHPEPPTSRQ